MYKKIMVPLDRSELAESVLPHVKAFIERFNIDLIIIGTHGRSGVTRWVMGSVADKLLRSASVPVLMVRAPGAKGAI